MGTNHDGPLLQYLHVHIVNLFIWIHDVLRPLSNLHFNLGA